LRSFSIDPDRIDVTQGGQASVGVQVDAVDDRSEHVGWTVYAWRSVDPIWAGIGTRTAFNPSGAIQFPFNNEGIGRAAGDYGLYVRLFDELGNVRTYRPDDLAALGLPAYLHNGA
jgi:hypothetical protein